MSWNKGTDLRNENGVYAWPPVQFRHPDDAIEEYVSVTTVLDTVSGGILRAQMWWQAEYVAMVTDAATRRELIDCWDNELHCMVQRKAADVLQDKLFINSSGARELRRRAGRGTVIHGCIEDYCYGQRFDYLDDYELENYVGGIIESERGKDGHGLTITSDYCIDYARQALKWCHENIDTVYLAEAPVFSCAGGYAGTVDLVCSLKGRDGIWMIDAKSSKGAQTAHEIQQAAYANAELVGLKGPPPERVAMPRVNHIANLYIQPEKSTLREWSDASDVPGGVKLNRAYFCFLNLIQAYHFMSPSMGEDGKRHSRRPVTVKTDKKAVAA